MHAPVYARMGSRVGRLPNLLQEMREYVRRRALLETAYARLSHATQRRPKSTTRTARFLDEKYGADGKSKRRLDWKQSSQWHYWIEGCLANSSTRFRKFFRITRSRFDEIYLAATDSGEFRINPAESLFARVFPEIPPGKHGAQLAKVCPLCLRIGACLRRLATGESYSSLETSFQTSKTVLVDFCPKFLKWFLKYYYSMYVGGSSGVGFDTKAEIEERERVFRALGLPGFITVMDGLPHEVQQICLVCALLLWCSGFSDEALEHRHEILRVLALLARALRFDTHLLHLQLLAVRLSKRRCRVTL